MAFTSAFASPTVTPNFFAFLIVSSTSALFKSALVGMQPQFKQTPPARSRSTTHVLRPSWPARIAAT